MVVKGSCDIWPEVTIIYNKAVNEGGNITEFILKDYLVLFIFFTLISYIFALLQIRKPVRGKLLAQILLLGLIAPIMVPGYMAYACDNIGIIVSMLVLACLLTIFIKPMFKWWSRHSSYR